MHTAPIHRARQHFHANGESKRPFKQLSTAKSVLIIRGIDKSAARVLRARNVTKFNSQINITPRV